MKFLLICACLCSAMSAKMNGQDQPLRVLANVTLQGATVQLLDLLPREAGPQLKSAAGQVSLGRAPDPGSFRVFTATEIRKAITGASGLGPEFARLEVPEQVVVRQVGWPWVSKQFGELCPDLSWRENLTLQR